jgi:NAD(P)-dependent dehydrogenase (short-subunit alcohol dehydrogenase family)
MAIPVNASLQPDLTGQVGMVTGAGRGIGRVIASALAARGMVVAINGRAGVGLESLADEISAAGGRALPVAADVSVPHEVERMVDRVRRELGEVDLLVNNAGIAGPRCDSGKQTLTDGGMSSRSTYAVRISALEKSSAEWLRKAVDELSTYPATQRYGHRVPTGMPRTLSLKRHLFGSLIV